MEKDEAVAAQPADGASEEPTPKSSETEAADKREDQTLNCVQCGSQFVFTKDEQDFFDQRGLHSPPKRCKKCRAERRRARRNRGGRGRGRMKDYRSPAFREKRKADRMYRSPAFRNRTDGDGIYRSPAFQNKEAEKVDEIYRSPAFQEQEGNEEIYRSPGFQKQISEDLEAATEEEPTAEQGEFDLEQGPPPGYQEPKSPHEIYRSPAFSDSDPAGYAPSYRRRQLHDIVCDD